MYWTIACQAPLSMEFFRQEYWSELPFPPPGDPPDPGMKPASPAMQADCLLLNHCIHMYVNIYTNICVYCFSDFFLLWVITKYILLPVLCNRSLLIYFLYSSIYIC